MRLFLYFSWLVLTSSPSNNFRIPMTLNQHETKTKSKITRYQIRAASIPLDLNRACPSKKKSSCHQDSDMDNISLLFDFTHKKHTFLLLLDTSRKKNLCAVAHHGGEGAMHSWFPWRTEFQPEQTRRLKVGLWYLVYRIYHSIWSERSYYRSHTQ